ncbi:hypothetical protein IE81DRAFT_159710 [Ceraceosorus guamensis]|uniref:Uncharacterized protein n=1 Tax=Ceraceosorus guamensis TaxID=1522189 RepID=A0A316VW17_9BASI|nr:hypothetical protein IE81DRAFT_159710 [Ceraceosorus guamensis]PWN41659.1 hypothetical protein IE81DRAFT_159710 [Ceraceosorus guamensis]
MLWTSMQQASPGVTKLGRLSLLLISAAPGRGSHRKQPTLSCEQRALGLYPLRFVSASDGLSCRLRVASHYMLLYTTCRASVICRSKERCLPLICAPAVGQRGQPLHEIEAQEDSRRDRTSRPCRIW